MGRRFGYPDGFIERADLDGGNRVVIVPEGATFTPKQIEYEPSTDRLYWCDREGMRVMSSRRDGSDLRTLIQAGASDEDRKDERRHCVGIALDARRGWLYWTQKGPSKGGAGRIFRASMELPAGSDPAMRPDVTTLFDSLPEPIDLLLSPDGETLYWTDRGRPPAGNTLNAAEVGSEGGSNRRILIGGTPRGDWSVCQPEMDVAVCHGSSARTHSQV